MTYRACTVLCTALGVVAACSSATPSGPGGASSSSGPGTASGAVVDAASPPLGTGEGVDSAAPPISTNGPDADTTASDAGSTSSETGAAAPTEAGSSDAAPGGASNFTCTWVLGIHTTQEWFLAGFTNVVDKTKWECSGIEMAQFNWANAGYGGWGAAPLNPCATNAKTPDRIVFTGVDSASTTVAQFLPQYVSVINIIKMKFPSVKRVDLMTLARAPGDKECIGANRSGSSWIKPAQDDAIAMTVAMFPGFVFALPKWEVQACSDFGLCPHISAAANMTLAKTMGEYFLTHD